MTRALHVSDTLSLPLELVTESDLAWAAGLFEGEGTITIGIRKSDETYRLVVIVGNTDRQVVQFFHARWGGWLQPAYGQRGNRRPAWSWTVAGPRAEVFLRALQPHVRTERVRAKLDLGLKFRAAQSRAKSAQLVPGYRISQRAIYQEFRRLNQRGLQQEAS